MSSNYPGCIFINPENNKFRIPLYNNANVDTGFTNVSGILGTHDPLLQSLNYNAVRAYMSESEWLFVSSSFFSMYYSPQNVDAMHLIRNQIVAELSMIDYQGWTPKNNNSYKSRRKDIKCKFCKSTFDSKNEMWLHLACHMDVTKCMQCPICPFFTAHKHHLEYHIRNHYFLKPFKCPSCRYQCVNKSMLKSHLKSHYRLEKCQKCGSLADNYCVHQPSFLIGNDSSVIKISSDNHVTHLYTPYNKGRYIDVSDDKKYNVSVLDYMYSDFKSANMAKYGNEQGEVNTNDKQDITENDVQQQPSLDIKPMLVDQLLEKKEEKDLKNKLDLNYSEIGSEGKNIINLPDFMMSTLLVLECIKCNEKLQSIKQLSEHTCKCQPDVIDQDNAQNKRRADSLNTTISKDSNDSTVGTFNNSQDSSKKAKLSNDDEL